VENLKVSVGAALAIETAATKKQQKQQTNRQMRNFH
jgi:hypothetical protein